VWEQIELSRHVKVARRPPGEPELEALGRQGVRAIIDLRTDMETFTDALAPTAEEASVHAHGMEYIRVPVSTRRVDEEDLDRVGAALRDAPKPVLIHCASGKRAGMVALVHSAIETGTPGKQMLEMAKGLDLMPSDPVQQDVFSDYVDLHETRADPLKRREESLHAEGQPAPLLPEDTHTLAAEMQHEHRRHDIHGEKDPVPAAVVTAPATTTVRSRLSRVRLIRASVPSAIWPPPPGALGAAAAVAGVILLVIDRRVVIPVLIAAGIVAAWVADSLRNNPPEPPATSMREIDRDIADLEKRVRRLAKSA
jgi:uncharacterized protein (TIGR01244 family)